MSHPLNSVIDRFLGRMAAKGELSDHEGAGKPLPERGNPRDAVLNRLMTESRVKPAAVALMEQIRASQARLKTLNDPAERKAEMKVLADLQMRLAMEKEAYRRFG